MIAAYEWAVTNNIPVFGFDVEIEARNKQASVDELENLKNEQAKVIATHNWRDFNRVENFNKLHTKSWSKCIDIYKWDKREERMLVNIEQNSKKEGTYLIVTGSGHLPFFMKNFPEANYPLS